MGPHLSTPPCGQASYQGDTMPANSQLVSALASTPALRIYLLSLIRLSYKPNNSTFGSVQPVSTFITEFSVHPHSCWGEQTLSCISLYMTGNRFGELYALFYCVLCPVQMHQEKTKGLTQSLSAHGRHFKPSSKEKNTLGMSGKEIPNWKHNCLVRKAPKSTATPIYMVFYQAK